jgi:competence protein ComEC
VRCVALIPSIAILAGVYAGIAWADTVRLVVPCLTCAWIFAAFAWSRGASRLTLAAAMAGYALAGLTLGAASAHEALNPQLRSALHERFGGFQLATHGPGGFHEPVAARMRVIEDAAPTAFGVTMRAEVSAIELVGHWHRAAGGVRLTVTGTVAGQLAGAWSAGRIVEAPVTFRRPVRYLNDGVPDFERDQALDGVALAGSIKSGLLVHVVERGSALEEAAARLRAHVRAAVARRVGARDPVAGAIVTAILIGDRTALPDEVRERLQAAGTYHVIAISGGNIAILAALMAVILMAAGARGRMSAAWIIAGLAAYACVVNAGPSVWRATTMAVAYLAARLLDHRSPPWNAMAVSAALLACAAPLDVRNVGFGLTFGATAAILEAASRVRAPRSMAATWVLASIAASLATEIVLLPISAAAFSRVTAAGLVLNLLAVPLMTVTQVAGLVLVCLDRVAWAADASAIVAAGGARWLVESASLVDVFPWLASRVPPPAPVLLIAYYVALGTALWLRQYRVYAVPVLVCCGACILSGVTTRLSWDDAPGRLRLTMFDVGQGEALLLRAPDGQARQIDAGGAGFDGAAFDIGGRVVAPALWARGVLRLDALAITHADPDHIGGALAVVRDFRPSEIWEGVAMANHALSQALTRAALASGAAILPHHKGRVNRIDGLEIRVLHPPAPDWERPRVRNDDSMVLEVRYGDIAMLLTGDIGADVERTVAPLLSPSPIRILKVAHHGSRTSTSQALLDAWKPQIALISCGRGNRFGHPAPEVVRRLEAAGARIYRTDRDGQITVETDGTTVHVRTFIGHEGTKHTKKARNTVKGG